jgi:hypothetical protein
MKKYMNVMVEKSILRFWCIYMFLTTLNMKKWGLEWLLSIRMCSSLAPEQLVEFYSYSLFKSLTIIGQCLVEMNILAPKIGALKMPPTPPNNMTIFSKTAPTIVIEF